MERVDYQIASRATGPAHWADVDGQPQWCWAVGDEPACEQALLIRLVEGEVATGEDLAWLGLANTQADTAIHLGLDAAHTHPGWLIFHRQRLLMALPKTLGETQRLSIMMDWALLFLAPTGQPLDALRWQLTCNSWRLQNYQTMLTGLQQQMQDIRKMAKGRKGLRHADQATVRLLGFLHRMEHEMHQHLDQSRLARAHLEEQLERQRALHAHAHPHHLISGQLRLDALLPVEVRAELDAQARQAAAIAESVNQKRQALQAILRLERDEEMSQMSRQQHWFSLILGALAVMTAIPLVTGELDGQGLSAALARLPGDWALLAPMADRIRPWFAGFALVGSLLLMFSAGLLALRRIRNLPEQHRQIVAATGDAVAAMRAVELKASDQQCAQALARALKLARRGDEMARFLCEAELGCRRPFPLQAVESARTLRLQASRPGLWLKKPEWQWIQSHAPETGTALDNGQGAA